MKTLLTLLLIAALAFEHWQYNQLKDAVEALAEKHNRLVERVK